MREDGRRGARHVGLLTPSLPWILVLSVLRSYRDFNTRFSGITAEMYSTSALQPLVEIRRSLDELINSETILIGHALENDLKTLRIIHARNVDTAVIFRHPAGAPYRRALRDLYDTFQGRCSGDV
jgi:RNA exonuclease 1